MGKTVGISTNAFPVLLMILLIPLVPDERVLTAIYLAIIVGALLIRHEPLDIEAFTFGLIVMTFFEYVFVTTGIETFRSHLLFGVMPLWLPFLWGYGFVAIRRGVLILTS